MSCFRVRTFTGLAVVLLASSAFALLGDGHSGWLGTAYAQDADFDEESASDDALGDEASETDEVGFEHEARTAEDSSPPEEFGPVDKSADGDAGFVGESEPVVAMDEFGEELPAGDSPQPDFEGEVGAMPVDGFTDLSEDATSENSIAEGPGAFDPSASDTDEGLDDDFTDLIEDKSPSATPAAAPAATPAATPAAGQKLYVSNLSFHMNADDLRALFGLHGTVISAEVIHDRETGRSRGYGFVEMATAEQARYAMQQLDRKILEGRQVSITMVAVRPR